MRQSADDAFRKFTGDIEGSDVPFMYLDVKNFCTTGNGNLIEPMSVAIGLRWIHKDTCIVATADEIASAWRTVKSRTDLSQHGGMAYRDVTDLILDQQALDLLFVSRVNANEGLLRQRFPYFGKIPADGQMALHSMSWAMGPAFNFPRFSAAINEFDFDTAAAECRIDDTFAPRPNAVTRRNDANRLMFDNCTTVMSLGLDPDELWWPRTAGAVYVDTELVVPVDPDPCPDAA